MTPEKIRMIYRILAEERPDPRCELNFTTPYELLVAVILSAQATDKGVNAATAKLFPVANTPQAIAALGEEKLQDCIRTIGLFRSKAKHLIEASKILIEKHGGRVPETFDELRALPGVGNKTANVVLNVAFAKPVIPVDTHIFRVSNRTGIAPGRNPDAVSARLMEVTPPEYLLNAHHWLLLHGRYCCRAAKPTCGRCLIRDLCESGEKTA